MGIKSLLRNVQSCIYHLYKDQGMNPDPKFKLPTHFEDEDGAGKIDWPRVERFLRGLSVKELETFAVGDSEEQEAIAKRGGKEGEYAHRALDTLFMKIGC